MNLNINTAKIKRTPLYAKHIGLGAKMVDFGGWSMPLYYKDGIIAEHLATRKNAGLFDVSHMGRFKISGRDRLAFLQHTLTGNAAALEVGESQYTIISDNQGVSIDDAYLYRFYQEQFMLVVNAANTDKDRSHLQNFCPEFPDIKLSDITERMSMLSLQGPGSKKILNSIISSGELPQPLRNKTGIVKIGDAQVMLARTGYTGEPIGFELFIESKYAEKLWTLLVLQGCTPAGLGARDTLRLEAGLPLYGHEMGTDAYGTKIPVFASPQSRLAVSFSGLKGDFVGKKALKVQFEALKKILDKDFSSLDDLPAMIMQLELLDKAVARPGDKVYLGKDLAGYITSGTVVPYWTSRDTDGRKEITQNSAARSIALALLDSRIWQQDLVKVRIRESRADAIIMPYLLRAEAPPFAYSITSCDILKKDLHKKARASGLKKLEKLIDSTMENTKWRRNECINLIPSEASPSKIVKILSIMDPSGRYAEHKKLKAYGDIEVFYYQGTDFISSVEELLKNELRDYLGCSQIESRTVSGQMANAAVFSALVDFLNRNDRKSEPKRISQVLNHHIIKGGHLSSQPMGALKDFVCTSPVTEKPAVIDFPTLPGNPYRIDVEETKKVILRYLPQLIIFGKSMMICKEPVSEIKDFIKKENLECTIMYDAAHVLGLVGPHFQDPIADGADIITGSTHKTFFGTQRLL